MEKKNPAAVELGRRRAEGADMAEVGKLGGRPRSRKKRCPCGEMTAKRARARGHKCKVTDVIYSCLEFRCPKCKRFFPNSEIDQHKCEASV